MRYLSTLLLLILAACPVFAQANAIVPNPDPEIERQSFIVHPGFEVSLYAADPMLAKPIQMNFDPQGRLWIAASEIYPQIKPGEKANDKILVLEDTDGDGKVDKTTVFADGLLIPTGVEPGDGGAYVANSTELIHLSASKPGGKADRSRVMLSGFGTEDTHHILHTFRWGPDQALYFNQSIYIHSHLETPNGVKRLNGGGIWRYKPEVSELEVFARGWVNTWGHHFDRFGQSFVTDGAGGEGINHGIPGGAYMWTVGQSRILHGMNPGHPKYCGVEVVTGRHLPDDWQGNVITNDFRGHRVCRFVLREAGSTYESRELTEVIKTSHGAFRPIDVKMGPDGAIYIADWYNPIIQHGEVDFRDPRRDHTHGRIWRVTAKGRPLVPKPKLVGASVAELLERLKDPEDWTRQHAKRVLKELGKEKVLPELAKWEVSLPVEAEQTRLEAAWVRQSLGEFDPKISNLIATAKDGRVRAACYRIVSDFVAKEKDPLLVDLPTQAGVKDPHPRARLEAVRTLAKVASPKSAESALSVLEMPMDGYLDYALWQTIRDLEPSWLPAFQKGQITFGGDVKKLTFALEASGAPQAIQSLLRLAENRELSVPQRQNMWKLLAKLGSPNELTQVFQHGHFAEPADYWPEVLASLEESIRVRKAVPASTNGWESLPELFADPRANVQQTAYRLAGLVKMQNQRAKLQEIVNNEAANTATRKAALDGLMSLGGQETRAFVNTLATKGTSSRALATVALVSLDLNAASTRAVEVLTDAKAEPYASEIFRALASQRGGPAALTKALANKTLPADIAKVGIREARGSGQNPGGLIDALTKAGNLTASRKEPTAEEVKQYVAEVMTKGNAARGEAIYRRKELQCLNCHAIAGVGGQVGPDMSSIGASAQPDYLVESILIPNKAVKEGFHAIEVNTTAGKVISGVKLRQTAKEMVLRTADDKEVTIALEDIESSKNTRSLMPDGTTDALTRAELVDLVRFLSEMGKIGAYSLSKARLVRRWQIIEPTGENMNKFRRTRVGAAAETPEQFAWTSVYTKVSGDLPLSELPKAAVWNQTDLQTVVRFQVDASAGGPVKLKWNSAAGLTVYVGATPVEARPEMVVEMKPGANLVTVVIQHSKRSEDLRVELDDVPGSPARVAILGGK